MHVYSDSTRAGEADDWRSLTGVASMPEGAVINHPSRTERTFTTSTTEAEYLALGNGVKEAIFTKNIVTFVAPKVQGKIRVLEDNQGAVALVENPLSFARSQQIDV